MGWDEEVERAKAAAAADWLGVQVTSGSSGSGSGSGGSDPLALRTPKEAKQAGKPILASSRNSVEPETPTREVYHTNLILSASGSAQ